MPESLATWHCLLMFQRERGLAAPLMEIGVYYGKSAALLANHLLADDGIICVDDFMNARYNIPI